MLQPEVVPFLQLIPEATFHQNNARPCVVKTVQSSVQPNPCIFFLSPLIRRMSRTEEVWDLVGRLLTRDPNPSASKNELWLLIQAIWNSLPQADIQNLFDFPPSHVATLIAASADNTKY